MAATICAIALIVSKFTLDVYQTNPDVTMSIFCSRRPLGDARFAERSGYSHLGNGCSEFASA
jgi:hypothetical protein